ncbi:MAG: 2-phospho-L-lactate transferase [Chloroflexota bacterium]
MALAGGVGGAKLAYGLAKIIPNTDLTIIVNTGDDFDYWGLRICPDLDTVTYTLADLANSETGWGRKDETWQVIENVKLLGGDTWFNVGDKDLATHLDRTTRLKNGEPLSSIVKHFCNNWNINTSVIPMTDDVVSTIVDTVEFGELPFQTYFVKNKCLPAVTGFRFSGIEEAMPAPGVLSKINEADAVVFCPSNPWVSIDPILKINSMKDALNGKKIFAVSPIINGNTIKGPAAKMYQELGFEPSSFSVANHYSGLVTDFVLDVQDYKLGPKIKNLGINTHIIDTIMKNNSDRIKLAQFVLNLI